MKRKYDDIDGFESKDRLGISLNPYLKEKRINGYLLYDKKSAIPRHIDKEQSLKLYPRSGLLEMIPTLSTAAQWMLVWVMKKVTRRTDHVRLNVEWFIRYSGLCRRAYFRARNELIKRDVIRHARGNYHWINVHMFFSGDRIEYAEENRVLDVDVYPKKNEIWEHNNDYSMVEHLN